MSRRESAGPGAAAGRQQPYLAWDELWLGRVLRPLWELSRQQWWSGERLRELQDRRIRALIDHAYARVPYYRELFRQHGLSPDDIRSVDDLARVPVLTRQAARERRADLLAEGVDPNRCRLTRTGGTSGEPLVLYRTPAEVTHGTLTYLRVLLAHGFRLWDKQLFVTGSRGPFAEPRHWMDRARRFRKRYVSAAAPVEEQIRVLLAFRPDVVMGYSQALRALARALTASGVRGAGPRLVVGGGEQVDDQTRADVKAGFGVALIDKYATAEADCVGWECPERAGYHLSADSVVVEFLRHGQAAPVGEAGHVIVTPLHLRAMPLIRYDLGDIARPMANVCRCGRGLPLMEMVEGRADSWITLRSGTTLPPMGPFTRALRADDGVVDWQIVQEDYDRVVVRLVVRGEGPVVAARVRRGVEELLRGEAAVRVELVERVREDPGAKIRRIISRVPVSF